MNILVSFANPKMGAKLFGLARSLFAKSGQDLSIVALHIISVESESEGFPRLTEDEIFESVRQEAAGANLNFETVGFPSDWIVPGIVEMARTKEADLLLLGASGSLFSNDLLGGRVGEILHELSDSDIAVLADNGLRSPIEPVLLAPGIASMELFPLAEGLSKFIQKPIAVHAGSAPEEYSLETSSHFVPWLPFSLQEDHFIDKNLVILEYDTYKGFHSHLLDMKNVSYLILRKGNR
ncbi:potassium transporter Kef [Leptospira perolatii]|uniref:Potassium transporter Kef n=1 Tax=Leptospira perolatii TaxID=2023191 RepID=A0A2M9ZRV5_9LEPT|nr:potassium transporter Kef [Leptospira perolatii]PJZ71294.1 potassium transporter Kef [Leptospira perolatii]PJZ74828.1 potassium transporter Kef [Leptospira perolatii]